MRRYTSEHHGCAYSDDALRAAVHISARYIADRFLPDKAIDLVDEAGSRANIQVTELLFYFEVNG
jgi:ATP-dependent Clp protease ATP-binding subunit ClpC